MKVFSKSFTQQEPIPQDGIDEAVRVLQSGRLHRTMAHRTRSETAALEAEYAAYQEARFVLPSHRGGRHSRLL